MQLEKTYRELLAENEELQWRLDEAMETIEAIRTGQVDALVVHGKDGHEIYSLKTADQTYRVFIEKMNEGALTLNETGLILYCNSMFAAMVGAPISKVLGQPFIAFINDDQLPDFRAFFERGWSGDEKMELMINAVDKTIPCQLSITTLQLDEGIALSVIVTDLSYQKEVQDLLRINNTRLEESNAALEQSNHDLQQFASVASHDLQEPLRKMLIFSNMLKIKLGNNLSDEAVVYLDKIFIASGRMKQLVSDILSYTRVGAFEMNYEVTNLSQVMNEILDDFEVLIKEKNATIEIGPMPVIKAAKGQIRQLFQNLIANALKFSKPGIAPHIAVTQDKNNNENCTITVTDNGIGFDTKYSDKIFSLFERLNTKDEYEGSGIGLSVAKKIVDGHGGNITVQSEEGKGSTFIIELPCRK